LPTAIYICCSGWSDCLQQIIFVFHVGVIAYSQLSWDLSVQFRVTTYSHVIFIVQFEVIAYTLVISIVQVGVIAYSHLISIVQVGVIASSDLNCVVQVVLL
jgi:hypothetical protein